MGTLDKILISLVLLIMPLDSASALELVSPAQYTEVHPGDTILIVVKPSPGELIGRVFFDYFHGEVISPPYEYRFTVGSNQLGDITVTMSAMKADSLGPFATDDDAFSSDVDLHLKSTLSSTIKIQSLRASYASDKIRFYLEKDKATGDYIPDTGQLRVYAMYSDGVERNVSSSAGTIYTSSDKTVLSISVDGLMTALKPGQVQITVKNGDKKLVQDATVFSK
jgi:hypothetical protein